ncbi:hypothetical protein PDJAM_G00056760 [Pangasius djambal]|uniref:Uncharacterized protein n=1 Tax=Pangasius djambal TaxID=1691987 RepID=A0ACC5YWW7_9TELE|nr:hypothetical protein [Pangasius djambal]
MLSFKSSTIHHLTIFVTCVNEGTSVKHTMSSHCKVHFFVFFFPVPRLCKLLHSTVYKMKQNHLTSFSCGILCSTFKVCQHMKAWKTPDATLVLKRPRRPNAALIFQKLSIIPIHNSGLQRLTVRKEKQPDPLMKNDGK